MSFDSMQELNEITQTTLPLLRSRSFKVTDFGTNQKPICDFLLVINTNLPFPGYGRLLVRFSLSTWECLTLMPPLGVILLRISG